MQIHEIKRTTKRTRKVQVGRGGKRGKTSGRGHKGQKARAGRKIRPEIRDIIKKLPKLRGRGIHPHKSIVKKTAAVNVDSLEKAFKKGDIVSPQTLLSKTLIRKVSGKFPAVKILSRGDLKKDLTIKDCSVSKKAAEKIEKVGGKILA